MPAAVVTVLRGRWLLFIVGWFTAGALWFVGALVPDDRASERERRLSAIATAGIAVAFVGLGLFGARPAPLLGMDGRVLQNSVGGIATSIGEPHRCEQKGDDWVCGRYDTVSSGSVSYRTRVDGLGCWEATLVGPGGEEVPEELSGCAGLEDFVFG